MSTHCRLSATHVMPPDGRDPEAMLRAISILGYPVEHGSSLASEPFYRQAEREGIRTLFSGHGGDEFVTNSGHLLPTELLHQKRWADFYRNLPGNFATRPLRVLRRLHRMHRER
ncbi:MAG: hypothetical protein D3909_18660, partial [Candidatus Electrothrix sp. ATG1]|nr:hypothetical protein [Candidatus Electrothrix sp. ATG1]